MARKVSLLIVLLVSILSLSLILVACGGNESVETTTTTTTVAPTTTAAEETSAPVVTTAPEVPATTVAPITTVAPTTTVVPVTTEARSYNGPNEQWIEEVLFEEGQWIQPHARYTLSPGKGTDGVQYDYIWYFSIVAEGGHFGTTAEDHPTHPKTPGIQMVNEPVALYIKDANDLTADYSRYEISYWTAAQWYQIWCVADGFVPVDGTSYDIYLVFKTPADTVLEDGTVISNGATWPETLHYIWDLGNYWTYEAPAKSESKYLTQSQLNQIVGDGWWLLEHSPAELSADGSVVVKFKSDGDPFNNNGDAYGVSFTLFESLYINGEEREIVPDSYQTQDWYILKLKIKDFVPKAGETYEILFTLTSNDTSGTGNYCKYDRYYVLASNVSVAE